MFEIEHFPLTSGVHHVLFYIRYNLENVKTHQKQELV